MESKAEQSGGINPREAALRVVSILRGADHVAYLAGGCVRDALMGAQPSDYDVATDARAELVRELFPRCRAVGEAFGVVLVRMGRHDVEVATFRTDAEYLDGRHPSAVEFSDAHHDAQRRDFTINGLFEDPFAAESSRPGLGKIIDFVGGEADIAARQVRAIGEPEKRFGEDYLRMLRAVRFAARLDFQIEERTARAIRAHARYLGQISRERIGQELEAMLTAPRTPAQRQRACELIQSLHLDGPTLNEEHADTAPIMVGLLDFAAPFHVSLTAWMLSRHFSPAEKSEGVQTDFELEAFVHSRSEKILSRWRKALCLSNDTCDAAWACLDALPRLAAWDSLAVAKRKRLMASSGWESALAIGKGVAALWPGGLLTSALISRIESEGHNLTAEGLRPDPFLTGDDLIGLGARPGPAFKSLLSDAYDAQLEKRLNTRADALAWARERLAISH